MALGVPPAVSCPLAVVCTAEHSSFQGHLEPSGFEFMEDNSSLCFAVNTSSCHWFAFRPTALVPFKVVLHALLLFSSISLMQAAASAALLAGAFTVS